MYLFELKYCYQFNHLLNQHHFKVFEAIAIIIEFMHLLLLSIN